MRAWIFCLGSVKVVEIMRTFASEFLSGGEVTFLDCTHSLTFFFFFFFSYRARARPILKEPGHNGAWSTPFFSQQCYELVSSSFLTDVKYQQEFSFLPWQWELLLGGWWGFWSRLYIGEFECVQLNSTEDWGWGGGDMEK